MKPFFSHTGILIIVTGFLVLGGVYGVTFLGAEVSRFTQISPLKKSLEDINQAEEILRNQAIQLKELDYQSESLNQSSQNITSHLDFVAYLEALTREQHARIISLPQQTVTMAQEYQIFEERFQIEGSLTAILEVIYTLEHAEQIGSVEYLRLETQTLRRQQQRQKILVGTIQLKRIKKVQS